MFARLCLLLARFVLPAWVGAGALFVVTGVSEVRSPEIDSITRDRLVLIRFPAYYGFGFALTGTAAVCAGTAASLSSRQAAHASRARLLTVCGLATVALLMLLADWLWVYSPLREMIDPPGQPRTQQFQSLHHASMWINAAQLSLCLLASLLACWPARQRTEPTA